MTKSYRTGFWLNQKVTSLKDCSLTIYEGETFGLLGPNGAGKTTLLKTLLGIIRPTAGKAQLLGPPPGRSVCKAAHRLPAGESLLLRLLTGWEFLQYTRRTVWPVASSPSAAHCGTAGSGRAFPRDTVKKKQLRQYSKGMLQRIAWPRP